MNIDDFQKICTIIETGSINKAAEQMYMSQPALSRILKKAEDEYGITLLDRTQGKKITLTEDGERFYKAAREILSIHDNFVLQTELNRKRNEKLILFGTAVQQTIFMIGDMYTWFYKYEPVYQLETRSGKTSELHTAVLNKEIDVAFIAVSQFLHELYYEPGDRVHTYIYLSSDSNLREKAERRPGYKTSIVHIRDLRHERFVLNRPGTASRAIFDQLARKYDLNPVIIEEDVMYQRMKLADEGVGSYVMLAAGLDVLNMTQDNSRFVMLDPDEDIESYRYLVCRKDFEKSGKFKTIRNCLKDILNPGMDD